MFMNEDLWLYYTSILDRDQIKDKQKKKKNKIDGVCLQYIKNI